MTRTNAFSFSLLFISAFLCFQASSIPFLSMENSTNPKYAGTSGDIDIKKDSQGFYVEADLTWYPFGPHQPQPSPSPLEIGKWMVSLSNSETMAAALNCLNFSNYDYIKYNWDYNMWETTISYPNFIVSANAGYSYILMDKKYWSMTDILFVPKADSCSSGGNASIIGSDRYGVLGFGTLNKGAKNFKTSKNFSVYIKPDLSSGKLLFINETSNYTTSSKAVYNLSSDVNWRLSLPQGQIQVNNNSADFKNSYLMFDINSDAIGLPNDLYDSFLGAFIRISGVVCGYELYKPECKYTGNIQDLPDIILSFNDTKVKIPSKIYATPDGGSKFKLNFKASSPDLSGPSYITPYWKDYIILDANFMSYYFTVFDGTSDSSAILLYPTAAGNNSGPSHWGWIVIVAVVIVVLILIGCFGKRKIDAGKTATKTPLEEDLAYNYSSYNQKVNSN